MASYPESITKQLSYIIFTLFNYLLESVLLRHCSLMVYFSLFLSTNRHSVHVTDVILTTEQYLPISLQPSSKIYITNFFFFKFFKQ